MRALAAARTAWRAGAGDGGARHHHRRPAAPAHRGSRCARPCAGTPQAWPWERYGPAVMAAVRAGVPVLGANLPRREMRRRDGATRSSTRCCPTRRSQAQQQAIRQGHCDLLPETQIAPMTRIQIARDRAMAQTIAAAAAAGQDGGAARRRGPRAAGPRRAAAPAAGAARAAAGAAAGRHRQGLLRGVAAAAAGWSTTGCGCGARPDLPAPRPVGGGERANPTAIRRAP